MTRDEQIEFLCETDFNYIMDGADDLLWSYLQYGHAGYENYTDAELNMEVEQRKEMLEHRFIPHSSDQGEE